jgi:hypothetical protein
MINHYLDFCQQPVLVENLVVADLSQRVLQARWAP